MSKVSIFDLEPLDNLVTLRGKEIPVYGISLDGIFFLMNQFPMLRKIMEQKLSELSPEKMVDMAPTALTTILAMGMIDASKYVDNNAAYVEEVKKYAKQAGTLAIGEQLKVVHATLKATLPDGQDSFKRLLKEVTSTFNSDPQTTLDTPSGEQSLATLQTEDNPGFQSTLLRRVG